MIFYFSGTGNTKWVASILAETTGERLIDIADELREGNLAYTLPSNERLGLCFPTHGWQPPAIVRQFIRKATFKTQPNTYVWALTTCGDNMGEAMTILNKELATKGLNTDSVFSVIMPESYVCLPFMYTDNEERVHEKIGNARQQLKHIAEIVLKRQKGVAELERGATPRLYSYVIGAYFNRRMISDKKFCVDHDVCTRCGLCAKICPVDNISGTPPEWIHNGRCTCCLACYHHCPVHAINYGNITRRREQYYFKNSYG
ncbi:MAG: EFR1 family ferrodoxin [Prevotella sp.]|nr:EFR1 family ferrodoxin [Prevotella sp.]